MYRLQEYDWYWVKFNEEEVISVTKAMPRGKLWEYEECMQMTGGEAVEFANARGWELKLTGD